MPRPFSEEHQRRVGGGEDRLPPNQRLTSDWPVLTYGAVPRIDLDNWRFRVWGEVEEERSWTWDEFLALGTTTRINDIHCVTHWSRFDNEWEGVSLQTVLAQVTIKPGAASIMFHSYGGYTTNVPLEDLARDDHALFAFKHDGKPLAHEHGGPMRAVIPSLYFWKSAKWVGGMEILAQDRPGFWELYGYHIHGNPWQEERYS